MELEVVATDLGFAEGPLWHNEGFLIFSDVIKNEITKIHEGKKETFLPQSGLYRTPDAYHGEQVGSNGIAYDLDGNLVFCQHGEHAISRHRKEGTTEKIVDSYRGKRLNSPNDLAIGPDGSIYFTDPPYGIKNQKLIPHIAQPVAGVYRWHEGELELLTAEFEFPNGICISSDYRYVFIGSNHEGEYLKRYELIEGKLQNGVVFANENADGIKRDDNDNLYLATMEGVKILSPQADQIGFIKVPEMVTNVCVVGQKLYITTPKTIFRTTLT